MESFELDNGMRFWLVSRPELSSVVAGWAVDAGSASDPEERQIVAPIRQPSPLAFRCISRLRGEDAGRTPNRSERETAMKATAKPLFRHRPKGMRHAVSAMAIAGALASMSPAHAQGIPVIDVANLAQAIQQVASWARQYQQMIQQYQQLVQTYGSLTGRRNLGEIFYNPLLKDVLPPEAAQIYTAVHIGGINGLTVAARAIRNAALIYDCENVFGEDERRCRARLSMNAQTQAYARQALEVVSGRVDQIEQLMQQINTTEDPKAIADAAAAEWDAITDKIGVDKQKAVYNAWAAKSGAYPK